MLAFTSVAYSQEEGAVTVKCSEIFGEGVTGTAVATPSGNVNLNCGFPGPSEGGGAAVIPCSAFFGPAVSGNIVFNPSGHIKFHCKFPENGSF